MTTHSSSSDAQRPKQPIRGFDVFAEYHRLKGVHNGLDEAHAKGYGLWVAKVVASGGGRRGSAAGSTAGGSPTPEGHGRDKDARHEAPLEQEWHELSGEPQTDRLFDREIIQRMGQDFYVRVFAPAIAKALEAGRSYESIRDSVRKEWKPARA